MEEKKEELKNEEQKLAEETCKEDNEINNMKTELEETTDRLKRLMAEFDNFKKRSAKEREGLYNSLLSDIVSSFLPVVDNLEKAVNSNTEDEGYKQGIELVLKQFVDVLTKFGVEEIKTVDDSKDNATSVNKNNDSTNRMTIVVVICLVVAIIISMVVTSSSGSYNKGNGSSSSASSVEEESNSIKDSEKADLTSIGIDQYLELLKGSEASVIYIGRPTCSHCVIQKPIMEHLVYKYGVKVNYLNTDDLDDDGISKLQSSNEYFSEGWGTPLTLVVKDGDVKDKASGETSIADLVSMFEKYDLIKK